MTAKGGKAMTYDRRYMVLLSGGLDSTAVLDWAIARGEVRALAFDYGQPHRIELAASQVAARRRGVPWSSLMLANAVRGYYAIPVPTPGVDRGVSRANLPARNMIFLSIAAAEAARAWPGEHVSIVIGATADDEASFPDCRAEFFGVASVALTAALYGVAKGVSVVAPWVALGWTKADIIRAACTEERRDTLRASVSCYAGTRCGACDACTLRAKAFASAGVLDGNHVPATHGGDPARERR